MLKHGAQQGRRLLLTAAVVWVLSVVGCAATRKVVLISNKEDTRFAVRVLPRGPLDAKVRGPAGEVGGTAETASLIGTGKFVEIEASANGSYEVEATAPNYGTRRQMLLPDPDLPSRLQFTFVEVGERKTASARIADLPLYKPGYGRRLAAVVGITDYEHWSRLPAARNDARRVAARLRELGFDEVLELYDRAATRQRILSLFGEELGAKTGQDDLAVIYFAGHGDTETLTDGSPRGYIVPAEAPPRGHSFSTAISMDELRTIRARMAAKHVLYVMDSCYSGLILDRSDVGVPADDPRLFEWATMRRASQILTAGEANQEAKELGDSGFLTKYLLEALSGKADADGDGVVTAQEIATYVTGPVLRESQGMQTPQFGHLGEGRGTVAFKLP
jgi:uncharacterized caspase-like protein